VANLADYLDLTVSQAREQFRALLARRPIPAGRQVTLVLPRPTSSARIARPRIRRSALRAAARAAEITHGTAWTVPRRRGYRGRMPPRPAGPQLGLFGNPVRAFSLEELTETVRTLERQRPGRTVDELSRAVFAELAMKRTRRAADLVAEAIRMARARRPRAGIAGSPWQASTSEVRKWAASNGFQIGSDGYIPEQAITAYNETHPDRPY
jgi:hypothetical protein